MERRRGAAALFCGASSSSLSMAAILCVFFSQHCLTWNFRAENCRTVFAMGLKREAERETHPYTSDANARKNKCLKIIPPDAIIAHKCGKISETIPIIPIFSTVPVLSLSHLLLLSSLFSARPNVFHLQITSLNQSSPTRAISLPSRAGFSFVFFYFFLYVMRNRK